MQPLIEIPERTESVACTIAVLTASTTRASGACARTNTVRQSGMTPELLRLLFETLGAPAFTGPRLECCAELVEWLIRHGRPSVARLLLEKLAQHEDDGELQADLLAMAGRCGSVEAPASV